jgi:L-lactate dehydrogenase complex protein LldG
VVIDAFAAASRANACTVHGPLTASADEVAAFVVEVALRHCNGAPVAAATRDAALRALPLGDALARAAADVVEPGSPDWTTRLVGAGAGITGARLAVAEQGVFALACSPEAPRATSLLPPVHVCVVFTDTIVETFAEAITRVSAQPLPSALTWVGGPSRTGDLEMVQTLGVHGPRAVDVVLVASTAAQ